MQAFSDVITLIVTGRYTEAIGRYQGPSKDVEDAIEKHKARITKKRVVKPEGKEGTTDEGIPYQES